MDLDAIAVFVKIVEAGSLSGAARLLNRPKATVSAKLAALEKRLRVNLIHRTTRKLHVTDATEKYFHHCANAVRELELGQVNSSLIAKRFFDLRANLWASPAYLQGFGSFSHPKDLAKVSFVGRKGVNALRLTNGKSEVQVPIVSRVLVDDLEAIKALTILGEGIGWLPDFASGEAVEAGTLVPVLPQWKSQAREAFYFVYAGNKYASLKVQSFIQTALDVVLLGMSK